MIRETKESLPIFFTRMAPSHFFDVRNFDSKKPLEALCNTVVLCVSAIGSANAFVQAMKKVCTCFCSMYSFIFSPFIVVIVVVVLVLFLFFVFFPPPICTLILVITCCSWVQFMLINLNSVIITCSNPWYFDAKFLSLC